MSKKLQTPSQTVGPYFAYSLTAQQYGYDFDSWVTPHMIEDIHGDDVITISGQVFDGEANPIDDAMIEIWQTDEDDKLFGRCGTGTDQNHRYTFKTRKPTSMDGGAPFLSVILFMRGQLIHLYTRIYFSDEQAANVSDETLNMVPAERQHTLIAQKRGNLYEFNIHMQGPHETVFFDI